MSAHNFLPRRLAASATISGLVAAPLALVAATGGAAQAAPSVEVNIVAVNDFHGRINSNTAKWASTVAAVSADTTTPANTLMVGAGDLIGASEFASSVQGDQPTIDVLNAVGLDASAVGNHEFDKGWADLRDRVIGPGAPGAASRNADWAYLASNVTLKANGETALPPYWTFTLDSGTPGDTSDDLTVGVVGGVTDETPSLVSPAGVADLAFSEEVAAAAKYADALKDGNPANGEADIVVASFHSGAQVGGGSTFEAEVAKGGAFARMAAMTGSVDAILNGHTHQTYAWTGAKPGGGTRAYLQTGEYAANVGQVKLTVDVGAAGGPSVTGVRAANIKRADSADLSNPTVKSVDDIVKAALAKAAEIGNQPVGRQSADITRAYKGVDESGKPAEDRGAESALGDLVANALRDGVPAEVAAPDLGIVNPGGLRADLLHAGSPATNPANTDGVITYAEANNVLPFVNNVWTVDLTGAQLKKVLEQQWQPAGSQRPYLHLGLSDNVEVTQDLSRPVGSRITSIRIDDKWVKDSKVYKVSTFSFLATGGDNFTGFKDGAAKDTGLVDRDVWLKYLQQTQAQPVAPDFALQQVRTQNLPDTLTAGAPLKVKLADLDMSSVGAVRNTSVDVVRVRDGKRKIMKSVKMNNVGRVRVQFTVPAADTIELVAQPSGTTVTRKVVRTKPTLKAFRVFPKVVKVGKTKPRVRVFVTAENKGKVAGKVRIKVDGRTYFTTLTKVQGKPKSRAKITLKALRKTGMRTIEVRYAGNDNYKAVKETYKIRVRRR
ncbi:5'-nucleotidase C-terminal domain-containing protein [Nocardioides sp. 616]|uniref:bifunctional metallophosphatase/5'-nucleotidase n=1 Tax=Nocardioides sp. 616 TaxID=2268090 RepID=UPI0013B41083|nr:5'-nucleotidase C-terminal domain-containing protein [Nocardioides sp. 616]